jgi:hypothetical protein
MYPTPERLSCHSFVLKLVLVVQDSDWLFSLSQAIVVAPLCGCPPRGGVAAWLLPPHRRQEQLVQGKRLFSELTSTLLSLHPASLSSTSLSSWLRVCEDEAAVTRLFLDSLTFGCVPLFGHPTITHIITIYTPYFHSSFYAQYRIVAILVTS